jgi:hypothetical protein
MDIDSVLSDKRKPQAAANSARFTEQHDSQQPTESRTSSEKRQRLAAAAGAASAAGGNVVGGEVTSSLLTVPLVSNETAMRLQGQPSEQLEELEEGAALEAMLQPPSPVAQAAADPGWSLNEPRSDSCLADELTALQLEGSNVGYASMEADTGSAAAANEPSPNVPQSAVDAALPGGPDQMQQQHGSDVLIRDLAAHDAGPIQMLSLESLDKNPLLSHFQQQRLLAAHMQQAAKAVAAAAALREQLKGSADEQMEQDMQEEEALFLP